MFETRRWRFHLPSSSALREGLWSLSFLERALLWLLAAFLAGSTLVMVIQIRSAFLTSVPRSGGELVEGIVGTPRFINPVIARSEADKDLSALVYSGLMRPRSDGTLIPDLAESYTVSPDATLYTFILRNDLVFHDGTPITADDIVYTISVIQNPLIGSPLLRAWEGITAKAVDSHTVTFKLGKPYAHFIDNTTIGILPRHIWQETNEETFSVSSKNVEPVGSGPFRVDTIERDDAGVPIAYHLERFSEFALGEAYLERITFRMYGNEKDVFEAYEKGVVTSFKDVSPLNARTLADQGARVEVYTLPRVFALFFNQNHNEIFADHAVREALSVAVNRKNIIDEVLYGYGVPITGPLPPPFKHVTESQKETGTIRQAQQILENAGWEKGSDGVYTNGTQRLSFSIATTNASELRATGEILERVFDAIGADATLEVFDLGSLHQDIIRPRSYDALLFGQVVGRAGDLFPFWHSSQRNDPGLNTALYTNITVDDILGDIRTTLDTVKREELYASLDKEIQADIPALFLYSPDLLYVLPADLKGVAVGSIDESSERFMSVYEWHTGTRNVVTKL